MNQMRFEVRVKSATRNGSTKFWMAASEINRK